MISGALRVSAGIKDACPPPRTSLSSRRLLCRSRGSQPVSALARFAKRQAVIQLPKIPGFSMFVSAIALPPFVNAVNASDLSQDAKLLLSLGAMAWSFWIAASGTVECVRLFQQDAATAREDRDSIFRITEETGNAERVQAKTFQYSNVADKDGNLPTAKVVQFIRSRLGVASDEPIELYERVGDIRSLIEADELSRILLRPDGSRDLVFKRL